MTDLAQATLAQLVVERPAAARVLERHALDYCCHGNVKVTDACNAAGIDLRSLRAELEAEPAQAHAEPWSTLDAPALAEHIVDTHHRYLHEELPLLDALAQKVLAAHGQRHTELDHVRNQVAELRAELEPHLAKEERILFPAIDALARGQREFPFGSVANPIRMMMFEHDRAGELLAELRQATGGYALPDDACASYRSLYERLAELERDTHLHIHKDNNVLFPAALNIAATA